MQSEKKIAYLERHFDSENGCEAVIDVVEQYVARAILVHRILDGECNRAAADHQHDEVVEVLACNDLK